MGFFRGLTSDWGGWQGERLTATHDGHVRMAVQLRQSTVPDGWSACRTSAGPHAAAPLPAATRPVHVAHWQELTGCPPRTRHPVAGGASSRDLAQVRIDSEAGTIVWPDRIDIAPEPLCEQAHAVPLVVA